jgi:methionyl-tRNA synthetase
MTKRLITQALPYANGSLHLGHLEEAILTDIYVRHLKQKDLTSGDQTLYVCADDQHGSAITLRAQKEGIPPEDLIARLRAEHVQDFEDFGIEFDHYHATHSDENRKLSELIYGRLKEAGLIRKAPVEQLFDEQAGVFLADRFVKGACPACKAVDQFGDNCDKCGASYSALELGNPVSQITQTTPVKRVSDHIFFKLSDPRVQEFCKSWANTEGRLPPDALNKLQEWLSKPLRDWDISRDGPYFGFEIPGEINKFFYVWLDAPVGYLASAQACLNKQGNPDEFTKLIDPNSDWTIDHIIGKDILYFHALFWPAVLHFSRLKTPQSVKTHGFLTVNGQKLSKSKGTFITARQYLDAGLDPEWLRYYFFSKLNGTSQDIDFSVDDFCSKVNSDIVGKYVNIASRLAPFIHKHFNSTINIDCSDHPLIELGRSLAPEIDKAYSELDLAKACRLIVSYADEANKLINDAKPWVLAKDPSKNNELATIVCAGLCAFESITRHLLPVIPSIAVRALAFLGAPFDGRRASDPIELGRRLGSFAPLASRVDVPSLRKLFASPP